MIRDAKQTAGSIWSNERGISLVEILVAVTIMSLISVTIMGYFTAATERSAEQNRRVIAASLARLKTAELRQAAVMEDASGQVYYELLEGMVTPGAEREFSVADPLPAPYENLLDSQEINGTTYQFIAVLEKVYPADYVSRAPNPEQVLLRLRLTVSWGNGPAPRPADSVTVDAYLVKPG